MRGYGIDCRIESKTLQPKPCRYCLKHRSGKAWAYFANRSKFPMKYTNEFIDAPIPGPHPRSYFNLSSWHSKANR